MAGDHALTGIRDGTRAGLSVEFEALAESREAQTGVRVVEALPGGGLRPGGCTVLRRGASA